MATPYSLSFECEVLCRDITHLASEFSRYDPIRILRLELKIKNSYLTEEKSTNTDSFRLATRNATIMLILQTEQRQFKNDYYSG